MTEGDFIDRLQASRDVMRRLQRSMVRYALPQGQREALIDGVRRLVIPGEQLKVMVDMIETFGPPLAQIEALRDEIGSQREQLRRMDERLIQMEAAAERLALASEQIRLFQEPFVQMAALITGQRVDRPAGSASTDEDEHDDGGQDDLADADPDLRDTDEDEGE